MTCLSEKVIENKHSWIKATRTKCKINKKKQRETFVCTFISTGYFHKVNYTEILSSLEKQENDLSILSLER